MPQITVRDPTGKLVYIDSADLDKARRSGYSVERDPALGETIAKYRGSGHALGSALSGIASTATLGLSDAVISELGGREALQAYEKLYPEYRTAGDLIGGALPTAGFGVVGKLGGATEAAIAGLAKGSTNIAARAAARAGGLAARGAVEGAFYGAGSAISESAINDTELDGEKLWAGMRGGIGMGAALSLGIGGLMHGIGAGAKGLLKRFGSTETALKKGAVEVRDTLREHGASDPMKTGIAESVSPESPKPGRKPPPFPEDLGGSKNPYDVQVEDLDVITHGSFKDPVSSLTSSEVPEALAVVDWAEANGLTGGATESSKFYNFLRKRGKEYFRSDDPLIAEEGLVRISKGKFKNASEAEFAQDLAEFRKWQESGEPNDWFRGKLQNKKPEKLPQPEVDRLLELARSGMETPAKVDRDAPTGARPVVDRDAPTGASRAVDRDAPTGASRAVDRDAPTAVKTVTPESAVEYYKPTRLHDVQTGPFQHEVEIGGKKLFATAEEYAEQMRQRRMYDIREENSLTSKATEARRQKIWDTYGANHVYKIIETSIDDALPHVNTPEQAQALVDDFNTSQADAAYATEQHLDQLAKGLRDKGFDKAADNILKDENLRARIRKTQAQAAKLETDVEQAAKKLDLAEKLVKEKQYANDINAAKELRTGEAKKAEHELRVRQQEYREALEAQKRADRQAALIKKEALDTFKRDQAQRRADNADARVKQAQEKNATQVEIANARNEANQRKLDLKQRELELREAKDARREHEAETRAEKNKPSTARRIAADVAQSGITAAGFMLGGWPGGLAARGLGHVAKHVILGGAGTDAVRSLAAKVDISMEGSLAKMSRQAKKSAIGASTAYKKRLNVVAEHRQALSDATNDPETTRRYLNAGLREIGGTHPMTRDAAANTALRAQAVLKEYLPAGDVPSAAHTARFLRVTEIINNPAVAFQKIEKGRMTKDEAQALKRVYPKLYRQLADTVLQEQINLTAQGKQLPYKNRLALSVMFDAPLDKTVKPEFISMVSSVYAQMSQPPPQQGGSANRPNQHAPELDFSPQKEHKDDRSHP